MSGTIKRRRNAKPYQRLRMRSTNEVTLWVKPSTLEKAHLSEKLNLGFQNFSIQLAFWTFSNALQQSFFYTTFFTSRVGLLKHIDDLVPIQGVGGCWVESWTTTSGIGSLSVLHHYSNEPRIITMITLPCLSSCIKFCSWITAKRACDYPCSILRMRIQTNETSWTGLTF